MEPSWQINIRRQGYLFILQAVLLLIASSGMIKAYTHEDIGTEGQVRLDDNVKRVDGGWGEWRAYGECSETCGDLSYHIRRRSCNNPAPRKNGKYCPGRNAEARDCLGLPPCPTEAPASGDCADDEEADCEFSGSGGGAEPTNPCNVFDDDYSEALCLQGFIDPPDVPGNEGGPDPEPDNNAPYPCSAFEDSYSETLCLQGFIDPPDVPGNEDGPDPEPDNNAFEYSSLN